MFFSLSVGRVERGRQKRLSNKARKKAGKIVAIVLAAMAATPALGTIYYVSPTGSDSNSGTSQSAPWGSVAKVDATTFKPGDEILFQYGGTWDASLDATSSGTASAPIVYGAYGSPSLGNPTFSGSNPIGASAFTLVSGTTYQTTYNTPVNWFYNNNQFDHEAQDALSLTGSSNASNPATDLSYVKNNPNSFYYNSGNGQLFVNVGSSLSGLNLAVGTRQDAIFSNGMNNLLFENLNTTQTAADNNGYGVRIENSTNVTLLNSTVSLAGKHNVGVTDTVGFVGTNIVANGTQPDLGYGGASAFATYGDANPSVSTGTNNTSVWTNVSYVNPDGAYEVFTSHGNANGIAGIVINNVISSGYGTGIVIYPASASETTLINGGQLNGSASEVDTNNTVINGLTVSGALGSIAMKGTGVVVQNSTFIGNAPNPFVGRTGVVTDGGSNNTIRFNTFDNAAYNGPAVGITNPESATTILGNIISPTTGPTIPVWLLFNGTPLLQSNYNLLNVANSYQSGAIGENVQLSIQQWQAMGYDTSSLVANPVYTDVPDGIYMLQSNSPGIGLYTASINPNLTLANSLLGPPNNNGSYNAGINPNVWPNMNVLPSTLFLNNGLTNTIAPVGNTLSITSTGSIVSSYSSTLNIAGNVSNSGTLISLGSLIVTGNFNNSGTVVISGSQLWVPGATFINTAGTATIETDTGGTYGPQESLAINISGGTVTFASTQHLLSLTIGVGGKAQVISTAGAGRSILFTPSLSIAGALDLTSNDLIVENGNLAAVTAMIGRGLNTLGGGQWNGNGIISSTAAYDTTHATALGVILNSTNGITPLFGSGSPLGLFDGTSPGPNDVLVKYTYYGDTNLDGTVDGTDYARIDNGYLQHLTGWYNGDFNYDGGIDGSDYTLIDNAFNVQTQSLNTSITAEIANPVDFGELESPGNFAPNRAVPEPTALALFTWIMPLLLRRRRV